MCLRYNGFLKPAKNKYLRLVAMAVANNYRSFADTALGFAFNRVNHDSLEGTLVHDNMDISDYDYFFSFKSQILYKVM